MSHVWRVIDTFFGGAIPARIALPSRVPVVAVVLDEEDRRVLMSLGSESLDIHIASSCQEAGVIARRMTAPIILLDRDWPGIEWRSSVEELAKSTHGPCVILVSSVSDDNLWEELIRRGGYEILKKPFRADKAARVMKLALSYWTSATRQAVTARKMRKEGRPAVFRKSVPS